MKKALLTLAAGFTFAAAAPALAQTYGPVSSPEEAASRVCRELRVDDGLDCAKGQYLQIVQLVRDVRGMTPFSRAEIRRDTQRAAEYRHHYFEDRLRRIMAPLPPRAAAAGMPSP